MRYVTMKVIAVTSLSIIMLPGSVFAQQPTAGRAQVAFTEILAVADKNQDGNLSLEECYAIWKNRTTAERQCKFWDSNHDGIITEEEYVAQTERLMK